MLFGYWLTAFAMLSIVPATAAPTFEAGAICRAALAVITDRDPKVIQVTQTVGDVLFLTYVRPIDNFTFAYRCRIDGNRVVWASEPGRWREDPKDEEVLFEDVGEGKQLRIIENRTNGSSIKQVFDRDKIL
jgi:hypothetical protein